MGYTRLMHGFLVPLLAVASLLGAMGSPEESRTPSIHVSDVGRKPVKVHDSSVRVFDIGHKPVRIHDSSEGWAEYPALAATPRFVALAYSLGKDGRNQVYYHIIYRERHTSGVRHSLVGLDDNGFRPSVDIMGESCAWIAWTCYGRSGWRIRAFVDEFMGNSHSGKELDVFDGDGFNSQVRVACGTRSGWFVWVNWTEDKYRVLARRCAYPGFDMGDIVTVRSGGNPVGRPDLKVLEDDHIVVAWDEYVDGRFSIRARGIRAGSPGPVLDLSGPAYSYEWGPHLAGSADNVLVAWQAVPGGRRQSEPRAAHFAGGMVRRGIARPGDDEAWRVRCLEGPGGHNLIAWATRKGYRQTRLFLKAMLEQGSSRTVQVEFPMRNTFINWFDCEYDGRLALAYESAGSVFLYDIEAPKLATVLTEIHTDSAAREVAASSPQPRAGPRYSTEHDGKILCLYFGDYHNHTSFSDGRAYPDISYLTARDYRSLDFMGVSDHDGTTTPGEFAWNCAVCDGLTRNGEYVCLYGYEENKGWGPNGFGHWNALLREKGDIFHFEEGMTPDDLYRYANWNDVIFIPHHIGVCWGAHNWDYFDPRAEPVVELCSLHGIFENTETCSDAAKCLEGSMISDGLERGYRFGIVGGSDYHNCFAAVMAERGMTGVYAEELTREHILDAIRRRRTFATTGEKIVVDFRCNGRFMGEEVHGSDPLHFAAYMKSESSIVSAEVVSGGEVVLGERVGSGEASYEWDFANPGEVAYFYLRLTAANGERAWSSPIFVVP